MQKERMNNYKRRKRGEEEVVKMKLCVISCVLGVKIRVWRQRKGLWMYWMYWMI